MATIHQCYASDYYGCLYLSFTSNPSTSIVYPAILTDVDIKYGFSKRSYPVIGTPPAGFPYSTVPFRLYENSILNDGGVITLRGFFGNSGGAIGGYTALQRQRRDFEKAFKAVTGAYFTSITITPVNRTTRALLTSQAKVYNGCQCIGTSLRASELKGSIIHQGTISYFFESIT